ncbi:hypothetical protein A1Q2_07713 [Trichosporon asahii var. asahii CBS 8904]|uniref:Uncharacterized protein n=1 Tax=Trichosporon asahii var. asahii (strain CBS 8904) TaxID=1220162 RepID=K1VFQ6_TRIAC|nr:hypothetical protein A1Q2_07713 [Trichosporon asahii var. asahii CBS 8904]
MVLTTTRWPSPACSPAGPVKSTQLLKFASAGEWRSSTPSTFDDATLFAAARTASSTANCNCTNNQVMSTSDPKVYDNMSKEERAEHDAKQREREQAEQAVVAGAWHGDRQRSPAARNAREEPRRVKGAPEPILEGDLFEDIVCDDSSWTIAREAFVSRAQALTNGRSHIAAHRWWPHVLKHHPKIDTTKIQPENSKLSDLDPETRAMVEKMMQKAMGKPTSDDLKKAETLAKFQQAHPEMDFSQIE